MLLHVYELLAVACRTVVISFCHETATLSCSSHQKCLLNNNANKVMQRDTKNVDKLSCWTVLWIYSPNRLPGVHFEHSLYLVGETNG